MKQKGKEGERECKEIDCKIGTCYMPKQLERERVDMSNVFPYKYKTE